MVESEFNHYLLRLNIGSQPQRNVRNVVVARKIKFTIEYENHIFYSVKQNDLDFQDSILKLYDDLINDYFSIAYP